MTIWLLAVGAAFGCAGVILGALAIEAQAALWAGLALLASVAGVATAKLRQAGTGRGAASALRALDSTEEGWYVARGDGGAAFINPAYRKLAGDRAPETLLGSAAPHNGNGLARMRTALNGGQPSNAEVRFAEAGARARWLNVIAEPLAEAVGGIAWRISDVTERRAAADAEREQCAWYAAMLDRLPVGLYAADEAGRLLYVNETLAKILGRDRPALTAGEAKLSDFVSNGERETAAVAFTAETNGTADELKLSRDDRSTVRALVSRRRIAPPENGEGERPAARICGVVYDVTSDVQHESHERFRGLFEHAPIGIAVLDPTGCIVQCNAALARLLRIGNGGAEGRRLVDFVSPSERPTFEGAIEAAMSGDRGGKPVELHLAADQQRVATVFVSAIDELDGSGAGLILHIIDTTDQKNLERQFVQAQKMQAVGQLAGGIAHDFNNLLTAIIGFCDLLLMRHQAGDHSFSDIMQIKQNANRAANLVRQLLAFSRQQTLKPEVISLTDLLAELSNLLRRLIGETIELKMVHGRDVAYVKADQGQLEQVIINLAVNARDAMPEGGMLTIRTKNIAQAESVKAGFDPLPAGDYVMIEVTDTGIGIPRDQVGKIFEPFYTTKDVGAGTGLGLSTVYGIVKQFNGFIFVDSEERIGTKFTIFLPQFEPEQAAAVATGRASEQRMSRDLTGQGTILLVEDEDAVRTFGARALRNKGYTVLEAESGEAALEVMGTAEQPIDLVVTDVVMPRMDGPTLTKHIQERRPDIKVIYISGYAEDALRSNFDGSVNFLPKPFSLDQLASKVKEVMAGQGV